MEASTSAKSSRKPSKPWLDQLKKYEKKYEKFESTGKSIIDRFRGESKAELGSKFNILRSNVATVKPALYAKPPKPVVSRRFKDKNPAARMASTIIERCLEYEITNFCDYDSALGNAVNDRLLPGRGVVWIRYEPVTEEQETQITEDVEVGDGGSNYENEESNAIAGDEPMLELASETTPCDYVYWKDFAHNANARTWEEVTWVARRVCIEQKAGVERFGDVFKLMPPAKQEDQQESEKYSASHSNVWEIWHKPTKTVCWVCEGYDHQLDEKPDPLGLSEFFPCPKPLYATLTTDSLIPRPDYTQYQDQADELDRVTKKITEMVDSLEMKGFYAKEATGLANLLQPGNNSKMIPLDNWNALTEKGGIGGIVDFMPIDSQIKALSQLNAHRDSLVEIIYQLSGISDIQRGASDPNETASAQQIKAQFGSIRLGDMKQDVARFARDILRMKAEVMAEKYDPQTLVDMSGVMALPEVQMDQNIVGAALQLLKDERLRNFSIDIESDTLVEMDERAEQASRTEFLSALTPFLEKSMALMQQAPDIVPVIKEMMLFGIRGFKVGQSMEAVIEGTFDSYEEQQKQAAENPQPPEPSPEEMQMQHEQQLSQTAMQQDQARAQMDMQAKQMELQAKAQSEQQRFQLDEAKAMHDTQAKQMEIQARTEMELRKIDLEKWKVERQEQTKLLIAKMGHENAVKVTAMGIKPDMEEMTELDDEGEKQPNAAITALVEAMRENNAVLVSALVSSLNKPKRLVRDQFGNKMSVPVNDEELTEE